MGAPKAKIRWQGRSFLQHCLQQSLDSGSARVVIVWGSTDLRDQLFAEPFAKPDPRIHWQQNVEWSRGPLSSLQCALSSLSSLSQTGGYNFALVRSVDRPRIAPQSLAALIAAAHRHPKAVIQCRFQGKRAHPLLYPKALWPRILALDPHGSIRPLLAQLGPQERILVDVDDPGVIENFDRPEDLHDDMQLP